MIDPFEPSQSATFAAPALWSSGPSSGRPPGSPTSPTSAAAWRRSWRWSRQPVGEGGDGVGAKTLPDGIVFVCALVIPSTLVEQDDNRVSRIYQKLSLDMR